MRSPPVGTRKHREVHGGVAPLLTLPWPSFSTVPSVGPKSGE